MKDFKVLFVLFVLFCSQGVWAQKWESPNWKNFSYPVIDFKDKAAGTKGLRFIDGSYPNRKLSSNNMLYG